MNNSCDKISVNNKVFDMDSLAGLLLNENNGIEKRNIKYHAQPMPSLHELEKMMSMFRGIIFPGFFGVSGLNATSLRHQITSQLDCVFRLLVEQICLGICFFCEESDYGHAGCVSTAHDMASEFMKSLPDIRNLLDSDVLAAYEGDPAAKSKAETIFCYPSILAMTNHRIAHQLYKLSVPLIPRIVGEMAHSITGIDIHPGASIGEEFFIDHGTGVVIGETCVIGKRCRVYQGVTLGALSFPKDENGNPIKGLARHPVLEDNVTVYAGATILGRVTIGANSMIGGNVWITEDIPKNPKVVQQQSTSPGEKEKMLGK